MINKKNNFLDYSIYSKSLKNLPTKSSLLINTINQYSYCIAEKDELYKKSLQESDVLLPDGISIVLAAQFLNSTKFKKIAGADVHEHYLKQLNHTSGRCFHLGASVKTLTLIKNKIALLYPNITVGTFSPPYKSVFTSEDNNNMISSVNSFYPDVLFVGMTAPKQEKWTYINKKDLDVKIICNIGAVFDFYSGLIKRPNSVWINLGLEWFGRLIKEPSRLSKRYFYYGPIFVLLIVSAKVKTLLI
jgi:N-acetylglucosaminyldiphosphoundecaprenol N-acetyl-beta-D-mannosaminyltransferase